MVHSIAHRQLRHSAIFLVEPVKVLLIIQSYDIERNKYLIIGRQNIWGIERMGQDVPFVPFQVGYNEFGNERPSVVTLQNHIVAPLIALCQFFARYSTQSDQRQLISFFGYGLVQQCIICNADQLPLNIQHYIRSMNCWSNPRLRSMAGQFSYNSSLWVAVVKPLFIAHHHALRKILPFLTAETVVHRSQAETQRLVTFQNCLLIFNYITSL